MRNRPGNVLRDAQPGPRLREEYALDRSPGLRLLLLFGVSLLPLVFVVARLVQLQFVAQDDVIAGIEPQIHESLQTIETTNGRILIGETVLARDVPYYRLKLHYRWLEEPADDAWLRRKATARLSTSERRDKLRVAVLKDEFLAERARLWSRLALAIGLSDEDFATERKRIQERVEGIVRRVEAARERRLLEQESTTTETDAAAVAQADLRAKADDSGEADERGEAGSVSESLGEASRRKLDAVLKTVHHELTTSPHRQRVDPVEITEEHDYHVIADNVPLERIADVISRPDLYPGLSFEMLTRREYPAGDLIAHDIGVREPIPFEQREHHSPQDELNGTASPHSRVVHPGLEQSWDRFLRGRCGVERILRNEEGEIIRREVLRQPEPGADLRLSLVEPLQRRLERLLDRRLGLVSDQTQKTSNDEHNLEEDDPEGNLLPDGSRPRGACVIAMRVDTGELLAAAVSPRFELQRLADHDADWWRQVQSDPRTPLVNRLTSMALPPGSVFKTLTAVAAMESGMIDPEQTVYCRGHLYEGRPDRYRCWTFRHNGYGHGDVNLTDALCQSCNVYFYTVAGKLGPKPIVQTAQRLGFGRPTGIDLPGETGGHLPLAELPRAIELAGFEESSSLNASRSELVTSPLNLAIGQANLTVTPLQILRLMACVANGGKLVTPRLAQSIQVPGEPLQRLTSVNPVPSEPLLSQRTLHSVREGLELVVKQGTGKRVAIKQLAIAGKTGTAEVQGKIDHAWFAGYVPADNPQVAFVVALEHGGSGGRDAGPIAKQLIEQMLELNLLR